MSYQLLQYNKRNDDNNDFMTLITSGDATTVSVKKDYQTIGFNDNVFYDQAVFFQNGLVRDTTYYFHGKIKRLEESQVFYVKLYYNDNGIYKEQYIKTIAIHKGDIRNNQLQSEWVDIEFIFTPVEQFSYLVFELQRDPELDYASETIRYPFIAFQELSKVENILETKNLVGNNKLIKIGIQSRPSILMCINGEEIRTSKTGIYEFRNGVISVTSFSVCNHINEKYDSIREGYTGEEFLSDCNLSEWMLYINNSYQKIQEEYKESSMSDRDAPKKRATAVKNLVRKCFFGSEKDDRVIDNFTLDYLIYIKESNESTTS